MLMCGHVRIYYVNGLIFLILNSIVIIFRVWIDKLVSKHSCHSSLCFYSYVKECVCVCVCVHICSASLSALSNAKNMAKDIKDAFIDLISSYITAKGETAEALCVTFTY